MDYSVGSLSDLITGSVTPNKKKVIKKEIKLEVPDVEAPEEVSSRKPEANHNKKKKKLTKKVKSEVSGVEISSPAQEIGHDIKKKPKTKKKMKNLNTNFENEVKTGKKRKLLEPEENEPVQKKSKTSENAERRIALKDKPEKVEEDPELRSRTIFVGNLPITISTKQFKKLFMKYGPVETVRIRGAPVANPKTSKRIAVIKKEFHPDRKSFHGFVRFVQREDAIKATQADGMVYQDHHLRIQMSDVKEKPDENKAIFVGNLSFHAEEEDLWKTFESCGPILSVRIVRDPKTGMGKGFGYVNFKNSDSVTLALEMENVKLKNRELRIKLCNLNAAKKNTKNKKQKKISKPGKPKPNMKHTAIQEENLDEQDVSMEEKEQENNELKGNKTENKSFQGAKFVQKKKRKLDKGLLERKKKVKQIAPK